MEYNKIRVNEAGKMRQKCQTIIVGAGPAGLIAGRYLENSLILEKKKEIGRSVRCGEAISKKALEIQKIKPDASWTSCEIRKIERIMPNGKAIGKWHKKPIGYVIDREKFEKYLAQEVKSEIKLDTEVVDLQYRNDLWQVISSKGENFRAKYLIGADSAFSVVRRKVFPENKQKIDFIPAIEYLVETEKALDTKAMKIYLNNKRYKQGYGWIFPKSKNTANIGAESRGELKKLFDEFLQDNIRKHYGKYNLLQNRSGIIPIRKEEPSLFKNNALLIGDAAALADPLFKGGMNQAMLSAKIAAQCILKNELSKYEEKIRSQPFLNGDINEASKIWHSFSNNILNGLGEILHQKGSSYLLSPKGIYRVSKNPVLRKQIKKILKFFRVWKRYRNYLW